MSTPFPSGFDVAQFQRLTAFLQAQEEERKRAERERLQEQLFNEVDRLGPGPLVNLSGLDFDDDDFQIGGIDRQDQEEFGTGLGTGLGFGLGDGLGVGQGVGLGAGLVPAEPVISYVGPQYGVESKRRRPGVLPPDLLGQVNVEYTVPAIEIPRILPPRPARERKRGISRKVAPSQEFFVNRNILGSSRKRVPLVIPTLLLMKYQPQPSRVSPFILWLVIEPPAVEEEEGESIYITSPWNVNYIDFMTASLDTLYENLFGEPPIRQIDIWSDATITGTSDSSISTDFNGVQLSDALARNLGNEGWCYPNIISTACLADEKHCQSIPELERLKLDALLDDEKRPVDLATILRFLRENTNSNLGVASKGMYGTARNVTTEISAATALRSAPRYIANHTKFMDAANARKYPRCPRR